MERTCRICGETKPIEMFNKNHRSTGGRLARCRACTQKAQREWAVNNPDRTKEIARKSHLKTKYGITLEQYDEMLSKQDGKCAICLQPNKEAYAFSVDHDHKCCPGKFTCGKCVRGLLCGSCNKALGSFKDDKVTAINAVMYLMKHSV